MSSRQHNVLLTLLISLCVNAPGIQAASSNYSILIDYPFRTNVTTIKQTFDYMLAALPRTDAANCLKLYSFNFFQLPVMDIYSPLPTLLQAVQDVQNNRTILFAGFYTYFGERLLGVSLANDTAYKKPLASGEYAPRLSNYWYEESIYSQIIQKMLLSFQGASTDPLSEKIALVTYTYQYQQTFPFYKKLPLNTITSQLTGSLTVFQYIKGMNAAILASAISQLSVVTTIVTILTGEDTNAFLLASIPQSLIRWSVRWIVCLLEGKIDFRNVLFNDIDTRNVTILTFGVAGKLSSDSGLLIGTNKVTITTPEDAFTYDMASAVILSLSYAFCSAAPPLPAKIQGITGETSVNVVGPTWYAGRSNFIVRVHRGLGNIMQNDTSIYLDSTYNVITDIPSPPPARTEIWKRTKPVKILFYKNEPDNVFKSNASLYTNFNDKIEGYMVDLLKELLTRANLSYVFENSDPTIETGTRDPETGVWNGIFGLVKSGTYDLSSSMLTWTPERAAYFDTVRGVMYYRNSLLVSNNQQTLSSNLFQFLKPLKWTLWLAVLAMTIGFSIVLTILNFFSPNKNNFSFYESFFFSVGSLLHGVTVDPPNRYSGRLMACAFWFFAFVIFALYIANYGAMLTKEHLEPSINSVAELLQAVPEYTFGTYRDSFLFNTLWSSNNLNERILAKMMAFDVQNGTFDYSFDVVKQMKPGKFVMVDESPNNEYRAYQNCFNNTGYFGSYEYVLYLSKYNDLTPLLQYHLDNMNADNTIESLQSESWPTTPNPICVNTDFLSLLTEFTKNLDSYVTEGTISLRLDYMGGIFIITLGGCVLSVILAFFEWSFRATIEQLFLKNTRRRNRQNMKLEP